MTTSNVVKIKVKELTPAQKVERLISAGYDKISHDRQIQTTFKMCAERGWKAVLLAKASKNPIGKDWQKGGIAREVSEFSDFHNIGVLLGIPSNGLVDIDVDDPAMFEVLQHFLPPTEVKFGRFYGGKTQKLGHWLYQVPDSKQTIKTLTPRYLGLKDTCVELRANGGQTMLPTSALWDKNLNNGQGDVDVVLWANSKKELSKQLKPTETTYEHLSQCIKVATASYYSIPLIRSGSFHDAMLAWCGMLLKSGIDYALVEKSVKFLVEATGQDNLDDRINALRDTYERIQEGVDVSGYSALVNKLQWSADHCKWLSQTIKVQTEDTDSDKPEVKIVQSRETEWLDNTLGAMVDSGKFYHMGGQAVTVISEAGQAKIQSLCDTTVTASWLSRELVFKSSGFDKQTGQAVISKIKCPQQLATEISNPGTYKGNLKPLLGVSSLPLITQTGRVVEDLWNYDNELKLFFACEFPVIPMYKDEALQILADVFCDFPFVQGHVKSEEVEEKLVLGRYLGAAISALLAAVLRPILDICPLYVITSSQHSDGKSVMSGIVAACVGIEASLGALTRSGSDEEQEKQLSAILSRGRRVVTLDNHDGEFRSAALTEVLTSAIAEFRILGKNETKSIPNKTMFILNGVNTVPALDLQTRSVFIKLARTSLDNKRKFKHVDVATYVLQNKDKMVSAAISLIHWAMKQEDGDWQPTHRFKMWDRMVRRTVMLTCGVDIAPPVNEDRDRVLDNMEEVRFNLLSKILFFWKSGVRDRTPTGKQRDYFRSKNISELIIDESEEDEWFALVAKKSMRMGVSQRVGFALNAMLNIPFEGVDGETYTLQSEVVDKHTIYRMVQL